MDIRKDMDMPQQNRTNNTYSSNNGNKSGYGTRTDMFVRSNPNSSEKYSATFKFSAVSAKTGKQNERRFTESQNAVSKRTSAFDSSGTGNSKRYGINKSSAKPLKSNLPSPSLKKKKNNESVSAPLQLRKRLTAQRMPKMQTVEARIIRRFPFKLVFLAFFGTLLFLVMIYNNVQINEKSSDVEALKQKIVEMDETIRKTSLDVERKNDLRVIEERALELGMVKSDQLDKRYITIPSDDKVTIVNDVENEKTFHMTGLFESIRNGFFDIINFFK